MQWIGARRTIVAALLEQEQRGVITADMGQVHCSNEGLVILL